MCLGEIKMCCWEHVGCFQAAKAFRFNSIVCGDCFRNDLKRSALKSGSILVEVPKHMSKSI